MQNKLILKILFLSLLVSSCGKNKSIPQKNRERTLKNIKESGIELKQYIIENPEYNENIVFLADMSVFSGYNRFFVYDLKREAILKEALVAHGSDPTVPIPNI